MPDELVTVPESDLADLRRRVRDARWPRMAFPSFEHDPSILRATLGRTAGARSTEREVIGTWDVISVDVPSREMIETASGVLHGAGLVTIDDDGNLSVTAAGARIRGTPRASGMRELPRALRELLPPLEPEPAVSLPAKIFDEALADYPRPRSTPWSRGVSSAVERCAAVSARARTPRFGGEAPPFERQGTRGLVMKDRVHINAARSRTAALGGPCRARTDDIHGVNVALYQLS